jgi:hypothetical protein
VAERREHKLLAAMRRNPRDNWTVQDIETVCRGIEGVRFRRPSGGSHYKVSHPQVADILTIPARKPLKPIYVKLFVSMMGSITDLARNAGGG